jgi:hypothetical protein
MHHERAPALELGAKSPAFRSVLCAHACAAAADAITTPRASGSGKSHRSFSMVQACRSLTGHRVGGLDLNLAARLSHRVRDM